MLETILYLQGYQDRAGLLGGGQRSLLLLLSGVDRRWYRPVLVCPPGRLVEEAERRAVETIPLEIPPLNWRGIAGWLPCVLRLRALIRKERAVLLHANDPRAAVYGGLVARFCRVPMLWHVRTVNPRRFVERATALLADRIVVVSEAVRRRFQSPRLSRKLSLVYNGLDLVTFVPRQDRARVRESLGLGPGPVVGVVGRLIPWKGHQVFLEGARRITMRRPDVAFVLVGDDPDPRGSYRRELEAVAEGPELKGHVVFTGFRDDVADLMHAFDLLVCPSVLEDPLPRVVLEVMAAARPLVASRVGGVPELAVEGETALLVPPRDPGALAEGVLALLDDPERARRMGEAGRRRVEACFSLEAHVSAIQGLYAAMLRGVPRAC